MNYTCDKCECEYKIKNMLHGSDWNQPTDLLKARQTPWTLLELDIINASLLYIL